MTTPTDVTFASGTTITSAWLNGVNDTVNFTQTGVGAVTRDLSTKIREVISIKDFGAVGDGIVDDTAAVQAFFNALTGSFYTTPMGGLISSGTYKVTSKITTPSNMQRKNLYWDGRIVGNFADTVFEIKDSLWLNFTGIHVENTSKAAGARAVKINNSYSLTFDSGLLRGGEYALEMQGNALAFRGTSMRNAKNGVLISAGGNVTSNMFDGAIIEQNDEWGIVLDTSVGSGYGKQSIQNCYFEENLFGDIYINALGHSLNIEQNHFSFNRNMDSIVLGAVGGGTAFDVKIRDNHFVLNGAYTVNAVKQLNSAFMNGVRVSGNKFAGIAGTTSLYDAATGCVEENGLRLSVSISDNTFLTGTGWVSGGGAAPTFNAATISPYGVGKAVTKDDQYVYQTLVVKPNRLYRITVWAKIEAPGGTVGLQIFDNPIVTDLTANGFGTNTTTSTSPILLEYYWKSGAYSTINILLRQLAGTGVIHFSDLNVVDVITGASF